MDEKMNEMMNGILEKMTNEQKEKAKACKTMDELMELAGEWGVELPDEVMDNVAGGFNPFAQSAYEEDEEVIVLRKVDYSSIQTPQSTLPGVGRMTPPDEPEITVIG